MDINNLEAFQPKSKPKKKLESTARIELTQLKPDQIQKPRTDTDSPFYPTEFKSYGEVHIPDTTIPEPDTGEPDPIDPTPTEPEIQKPIIDLFQLIKNCSEYIKLFEDYNNALLLNPDTPIIDRYSHIQLMSAHNYFKSIQNEMSKPVNLDLTKIEFETNTYIFRDFIWDNYVLDFRTDETLLINVFFDYIKDKSIDTSKFVILATDKATPDLPVLNHNYCSRCHFKNICQRRALEEN